MIIKNSIRKIFIVLGISSLFFAITSFSSADYFVNDTNIYTTRSDYIQNLSVGLGALKPDNINELIFEYCVSILGGGRLLDNDLLYSPRQSAFVYLLCTNIEPNYAIEGAFTGYFKNSDFDKLGLPVNKKDINLVYKYVDDLFNNIMDDYFVLKQANVYGLQTDKEDKIRLDKQVNDFSAGYFNGIEICGTNPTYSFPKSCKYATQYLREAKKMYTSLDIISIDGLHQSSGDTVCPVNNKIDGVYDLMYCGLLGNPKEKKLNSFVNLVYNELFYYNLFVQYSTETIKSHNDLKLSASNKSLADKDSDRNQWVQEMQTELYFSQEAVKVSISVLRQSFVTYPVHIGFLMYRESLQGFGQALAKIATPIYTLYDKFRNVQDPGS